MDLAVKWRFFRALLCGGGDADSERVYRWHIEERSGARLRHGITTDRWKRTLDDYVEAAKSLVSSMSGNGFLPYWAVPIDADGELLDGSHRVACALACELPAVYVDPQPRKVWAPAWGIDWFKACGMPKDDMDRMLAHWELMRQ
jgi:hypothetical protein